MSGSMSNSLAKLQERVNRLERWRREVDKLLFIMPESIDPLKNWDSLDALDKSILKILLHPATALSTSEISSRLSGIHRTKVWRRLKKVKRISRKIKGDSIVIYDPSSKKWSMNTETFEFKGMKENEVKSIL